LPMPSPLFGAALQLQPEATLQNAPVELQVIEVIEVARQSPAVANSRKPSHRVSRGVADKDSPENVRLETLLATFSAPCLSQ
jgi:hypothetical protein